MKDSENLHIEDEVEYYDFMADHDQETDVPPAVTLGYVPSDTYISTKKTEKIRVILTEVTAIAFGLGVAGVYSIFAYFGLNK